MPRAVHQLIVVQSILLNKASSPFDRGDRLSTCTEAYLNNFYALSPLRPADFFIGCRKDTENIGSLISLLVIDVLEEG